jgi:hypothetical protein
MMHQKNPDRNKLADLKGTKTKKERLLDKLHVSCMEQYGAFGTEKIELQKREL